MNTAKEVYFPLPYVNANGVHKYAEVAKILDLACLEKRCPKGFGVFADRVDQQLQLLAAA